LIESVSVADTHWDASENPDLAAAPGVRSKTNVTRLHWVRAL